MIGLLGIVWPSTSGPLIVTYNKYAYSNDTPPPVTDPAVAISK